MKDRIRINKYLSLCGLGSRRKAEEHIRSGKIRLNGKTVESLSLTIDPDNDIIEFNNRIIYSTDERYFIILNKPEGFITSVKDELGRPTVMDILPERYKRAGINPVGRLDKDSEGLLLLTNDGRVSYRLTHPKFRIKKEYIVELDRPLAPEDKLKIEKGVFLYGERTNPSEIIPMDTERKKLKTILTEGKKRHIRLTFGHFSYKVKSLRRISFGPIRLGRLKPGSFRLLNKHEIEMLEKI
jgi:23S rRNA pseudouridine2605 synthase